MVDGNFLAYSYEVRKLTEKTVRKEFLDNGHLRSREFHLDHKLSIREGYDQEVPPDIIAHICNIEIITRKDNLSKSSKSSITFSELLEEISERDDFF